MLKLVRTSLVLAALITVLILSTAVRAAPKSVLIEGWQAHNAESTVQVDHSAWQAILDKYLDDTHASGVNRFDYAAVSAEDKQSLVQYLESLQAIEPHRLSKDEQKAYWINFYNAGTVNVVLDNYPVGSIRNIRPNLFALSRGPWNYAYFTVSDAKLTLNNIEHGILRPIWKDPRVHFVLNCASIGCPSLLKEAFSAHNVNNLLDRAAATFLNHPRAVSLKGQTLMLSSIFDWYRGDFGDSEAEIVKYIGQYSSAAELNNGAEGFSIKYHYDWSLNDK